MYLYIHIYIYTQIYSIYIYIYCLIKGSLEVKLPTSWTDEKAEVGRVREEKRRKKIRESEKEKEPSRSKVAKHCVFPMICSSGGSKNRLAKAAGAEPSGEMRYEKLHAVVARSTFESQNAQAARHARTTFGS